MKSTAFSIIIILIFLNQVFSQEMFPRDSFCCSLPCYAIATNNKHTIGNDIATTSLCDIKVWNVSSGLFLSSAFLKGHQAEVTSVDFSKDGYSLASGAKDNTVRIWNLILKKEKGRFTKHSNWVNQVIYSHNGKMLASCGRDGNVFLYDPAAGTVLKQIMNDSVSANTIGFNDNDSLLAIGSNDGKISIVNLSNLKTTHYAIHQDQVNTLVFIPNTNLIASGGQDKNIKIYDFQKERVIADFIGHSKPVTTLCVLADSNQTMLISGSEDETIRVWSVNSNAPVKVYSQSSKIYSLAPFQPNTSNQFTSIFLSSAENRKIQFWNWRNANPVAELLQFQNNQSVLRTSEFYFYASFSVKADSVFLPDFDSNIPLEYLDYKYNRPDKVLETIGYNNEKTELFKTAANRRLLKRGLDTTNLNFQYVPRLIIKNLDSVPKFTGQNFVNLDIWVSAEKIPLQTIRIEINGVPELIEHTGPKFSYSSIKKLRLSNGSNNIKIFATNELGFESKRAECKILNTGAGAEQNLYIISIGVSQYSNNVLNLQYPAIDARNFLSVFTRSKKFKQIYSYLLVDAAVTKTNILALKDKLATCGINDEVIIFFAGHGLMDKNMNYSLGLYDTDLKKIDGTSMPSDDLIGLFRPIAARNRLLFIDASNSGGFGQQAFDEHGFRTTGNNDSVKIRGLGPVNYQRLTLSEVEKIYFTEPQNAQGIHIMTSSTETESSLESSQFKGGIFTYSILNALKDRKTDLNNDNQISFEELYRKSAATTTELSGGAQHPSINAPQAPELNLIENIDSANFIERPDNAAPVITFVEPEFASRNNKIITVNSGTITFKGVIYDQSAIKSFSLADILVPVDSNGRFKKEVPLLEGVNLISVSAEDAFGNIYTDNVTVINTGFNNNQIGKFHALIIGVNNYADTSLTTLDYPLNDAARLKKILISMYNFDSTDVTLLPDPTRSKIYDAFAKLEGKLTSDENLLIFYAGHGEMKENANQGYWLPSDALKSNQANWISNNDIITLIKPLKPNHILLISDACFSGKMLIKKRSISDSLPPSVVENLKMKCRRAITSGALQTVPDKSIFMEFFCDYLMNNKENWFSSRQLFIYLRENVTNSSDRHQIPLDGRIEDTDDESADFIFFRRH